MPLIDEDPFARPAPKPVKLEELSIHELEDRIGALKDEIARCEALISAKRVSASAADAFFRKTS
jgi:uncharacterized small protein (DUF1192 family)